MSLLLDALRRAEDDSRKRKREANDAGSDLAATPGLPELGASPESPELTLQAQTFQDVSAPADVADRDAGDAGSALPGPSAFGPRFPELTLSAEPPATPVPVLGAGSLPPVPSPYNPRPPTQPSGRYARPGSLPAEPVAERSATMQRVSPAGEPAEKSTDAVIAQPAVSQPPGMAAARSSTPATSQAAPVRTSERQALLAAGIMAGRKTRAPSDKQQRRQWVLAALVLLIALPLVAFLLFGDALLGSSGILRTASGPKFILPLPDNASVLPSPPPPLPAAAANVVPAPPAIGAPAPQQVAVAAAPPVVAALAPREGRVAGGSAGSAARSRRVAQDPPRNTARRSIPGNNSGRGAAVPAPGVPGVALMSNPDKPVSLMDAAYAAYQAGKLGEATRIYQDVLRADPTQRDAWLGLAVIAHGSNQREAALAAYKQVLRLEPQNATALAGLSSLITSAGEPQQESRLRELLARSPQEADLHHALGLVLSGEQRWSEAQPLFFKAHALAPQEAQFAYNLAVTLDHLRKPALAVQYYETALGLAQGKATSFDETSARTRIAALRARASAGSTR